MTPTAPTNIVLIGYRGCGKTTVGRLLARRLARTFVDTDALIEQQAGISIAEMFTTQGEKDFRHRESAAIHTVAQQASQVIAVGGGAVMDPQNAQQLQATGTLIWLTAPAQVLWERISQDPTTTRPDLTPTGGLPEVRQILAQREPTYRAVADLILNTDHQTLDQVVEAIISSINQP